MPEPGTASPAFRRRPSPPWANSASWACLYLRSGRAPAADHVSYALALMEVAAGDGSCSTIMSVHNSVGCMPILKFGSADQKERFSEPMAQGAMLGAFCLTEPQAGSDAAAIRTRAERDGNHYVLNGVKQFITSGKNGDLAVVFAVTDPIRASAASAPFWCRPTRPATGSPRWKRKLGQKASDTCQIVFEDCRLTPDLLLGTEGEGYKIALATWKAGVSASPPSRSAWRVRLTRRPRLCPRTPVLRQADHGASGRSPFAWRTWPHRSTRRS